MKVELAGVNFSGSSNRRVTQHTPIKNNETKLLPTSINTSKNNMFKSPEPNTSLMI